MIQIDFFDKDIVSTLLPINTTRPDKVIFLIDRRTLDGHEPENVKRAIKHLLPETQVVFEPVTVDDLEDIYKKLEDIVSQIEDLDDTCIDLTGGTELMSACGYRIAREYDILAIYVDVRREHVIDAETREVISPIRHINLESCLSAIGAKRLKDSHDLPKEEEFDDILAMCKLIFSSVLPWQDLCQYIANTTSGSSDHMRLRLPSVDKIGRNHTAITRLVEGFIEHGFWKRISSDGDKSNDQPTTNSNPSDQPATNRHGTNSIKGEYQFTSKKARSYMTTFGTWLELFIYINALQVFDEAALGVVIDWYEDDHIDTQDNEIDVVAMRRSIPIFISCKMRKPVSGDLYEVGFVASRLGGSRAKALLATTYPVKEMGVSPKRMYQRMKKLKVGLVETDRFEELSPSDVFNQAIQMAE